MLRKFIYLALTPFLIGSVTDCAVSKPKPISEVLKNPGSITAQVTGSNGYRWNNVSIGGGGFVTGIYLHPLQKDLVYIKTDVGGFYRWDAVNKSWIPLNESFSQSVQTYYGGEAFAVDPNNTNTVYMAAGKFSAWTPKGSIFKSTNQGQTWTKLNINLGMDSNGDHRWAGERLVVNPSNSNVIFFASRHDGLWKSSDGGGSWAKVTSLSAPMQSGIGVLSIVFDKRSPGTVYANVYGDGIYKSSDTGGSWSKVAGSPTQAQRIAIASNGVIFVTHNSGVSKYTNGTWTNITPNNQQAAYNALAVNPSNANDIIVASKQSVSTKIFQTTNGGSSWTQKTATINNTVPWWDNGMFSLWTSAIEFDPKVPGKVWFTDGFGIWQTDNITANPVTWSNYQKGHEEVVTFALAAPPKGSLLLSGVADVDGFNHNNGLNTYPTKRFNGTVDWRETFSIAYSESNPSQIVRVGGANWKSTYTGATSTDGGLTWTNFRQWTTSKLPLRVAVSASNPNSYVVIVSNGQPLRTTDNGASWSTVSGLPNGPSGPWYWRQPLAADKVDGNKFYYFSDGKIYRSTNGGSSFSIANSAVPYSVWELQLLKTVPGSRDEVWFSSGTYGLHRSTNGGSTFTKLSSVERSHLIAFGKPPAGSTTPALYLYGKVTGLGEGIFRSLDKGQTWVSIGSPQYPIGNEPSVMEASWQQYGLVFIGTNGRGIYFGAPDTTQTTSMLPSSKSSANQN